jgi:hypothetical protein
MIKTSSPQYREPEPFISSSPVQFLQEILDDNIEEADFLDLEVEILNALHFRLTMPSVRGKLKNT